MEQIVLTLACGALIGLALGLVGGSSLLTVPILVYVLGESMHLVTGTALASVGTNALMGPGSTAGPGACGYPWL